MKNTLIIVALIVANGFALSIEPKNESNTKEAIARESFASFDRCTIEGAIIENLIAYR